MAPGLRFFGPERGAKAIDLSERGRISLVIKLPGLSEVGLSVLKIVDAKERGGSLAGRRCKYGRVHKQKAVRIEVVTHRADDLSSHR